MRKPTSNDLSDALRLVRVFHDLSLTQLSKFLSVSPGYLSQIESGNKKPNLRLINAYSMFFQIQPSQLFLFAQSLRPNRSGILSNARKNFKKFYEAVGVQS